MKFLTVFYALIIISYLWLIEQINHINFATITSTLSKLPSTFSESLKLLSIILILPWEQN